MRHQPARSGRLPTVGGSGPVALALALLASTFLASGCGERAERGGGDTSGASGAGDPIARTLVIADEYVDGYYHQFPEEAYEVGYPNVPFDRLGDRSVEGLARWHAREDAWLEELGAIDPATLEDTEAAIPYAYALDRLAASVARRSCRMELWNVSSTWTGWQSMVASTFAQQPVGTDEARSDALARIRDLPRYLDTEIANLREGVRIGYTAPRSNVEAVLAQMNNLLDAAPEDSPWFDPAARDGSLEFADAIRVSIVEDVNPAIRRYRDYLAEEYMEKAREEVGVGANPNGAGCYLASIRYYTSLPLSPMEIFKNGLKQMERIQAEIQEIGRRSFGTEDTKALLELVRTDPQYTFSSGQEVLDYAQAAVDRAQEAVPEWFGFVPRSEVVIRPFPAFQKRSGGGFYSAGAEDGSRPGTYELGTYAPETISKAGMEATAFHETYPGHHMQVSVGLERAGVHPVLRYFFFSGTGEGWALYTERLAEEMGLYSSDLDRLGMLSNQALRAARLVVDPGMHALGWTRQEAIDYLLEKTAESEAAATSEIDRYIAVPAQATSYMTGSTEIVRLRAMAEAHLGDAFDIRAFHDLVIADGTVTLGMLRKKVVSWMGEQQRMLPAERE